MEAAPGAEVPFFHLGVITEHQNHLDRRAPDVHQMSAPSTSWGAPVRRYGAIVQQPRARPEVVSWGEQAVRSRTLPSAVLADADESRAVVRYARDLLIAFVAEVG
jgi:hypothetical protein